MFVHRQNEPRDPARVVVLGAGGFVGRELVRQLAAAGIETLALGRERVDLTTAAAAESLAAELREDDAVVFLSALTPDKGRGTGPFLANLKMAASVCAAIASKPVAHVVYVSSDAVYPFRTGLIDETACAEPVDLYAAMHIAREIMVKEATKAPVAILRPTLIYGASDTHNSYGPNRLRRMALKERCMSLFGGGEETRDHIYVDDVAKLILLTIRHRSEGLLNVASGASISYADLARMIARLFAFPIEIKTTVRQNAVTHRAFDISALYRAFPSFRFTPLEGGLKAAIVQEMP